ncbi:MAG: T9SS type A sorting domain-containing protein [Saprospiraceae bacterium]|nr:T9SS type A sorting domain-containing protein [Saprospiraceae bacterium]
MKRSMILCLCLLGQSLSIFAQIGTTFSEPATSSNPYVDPGNPNSAHPLPNHPGEMLLNHAFGGNELGFSAFYIPTRTTSIGLTDGDLAGITDSPTIFLDEPGTGGWQTAGQGLEIEDTDGRIQIVFTEVDLSGTTNPMVSVRFYLSNTGYEFSEGVMDNLRFYCRMDFGAYEIDLLNTAGQDIDDMGIEGDWLLASQVLPPGSVAELIIEADFNSNAEELFIDEIQFSEGGPLPVELLAFEGTVENGGIHLIWTTVSEQNNAHFQVERSSDGIAFDLIGQINGAGTSMDENNYDFLDLNPLPGWNYYRLRQVDFNGRDQLTKVIAIEVKEFPFRMYPNPLSGNILRLSFGAASGISAGLYLYNAQGLLINSWSGQTPKQLDLSGMPRGVYILCSGTGQCQTLLIEHSP